MGLSYDTLDLWMSLFGVAVEIDDEMICRGTSDIFRVEVLVKVLIFVACDYKVEKTPLFSTLKSISQVLKLF